MSEATRAALTSYRRRRRRQGLVRVEVQVHKQDASLVRDVAKALNDNNRAKDARAFLHERFRPEPGKGFKALLASAPLEGVDLARERNYGRDVSL